MKSSAQWQSDQRAGEHDRTKCAVESGTGCPKSLQVRDPKCFTMVYSKQVIKKNVKVRSCLLFFLIFVEILTFELTVNMAIDPPGTSIWLQTSAPLISLVFWEFMKRSCQVLAF